MIDNLPEPTTSTSSEPTATKPLLELMPDDNYGRVIIIRVIAVVMVVGAAFAGLYHFFGA